MSRFRGAAGVPVVPNACQVQGRVETVRPDPGGTGSLWDLAVTRADSVDNSPNFARDRVGHTISLYVPDHLAPGIAAGDTVSARVAFRGDERGGCFVLTGDGARRL